MRPAPSALCPTSLLPMSASLGIPTPRPCALSCRYDGSARNRSSTGVRASATASPASPLPIPTPSITTHTTGPRGATRYGWAASFSIMFSSEHVVVADDHLEHEVEGVRVLRLIGDRRIG